MMWTISKEDDCISFYPNEFNLNWLESNGSTKDIQFFKNEITGEIKSNEHWYGQWFIDIGHNEFYPLLIFKTGDVLHLPSVSKNINESAENIKSWHNYFNVCDIIAHNNVYIYTVVKNSYYHKIDVISLYKGCVEKSFNDCKEYKDIILNEHKKVIIEEFEKILKSYVQKWGNIEKKLEWKLERTASLDNENCPKMIGSIVSETSYGVWSIKKNPDIHHNNFIVYLYRNDGDSHQVCRDSVSECMEFAEKYNKEECRKSVIDITPSNLYKSK